MTTCCPAAARSRRPDREDGRPIPIAPADVRRARRVVRRPADPAWRPKAPERPAADRGPRRSELVLGVLALAHDRPDVGLSTRRIGMELEAQDVPIGEQHLDVGVAHPLEDVLRVESGGPGLPTALLESPAGPIEAIPDGREEQVLLGPEQLEQVGLGYTGPASDQLGRGACEPTRGELDGRGRDDLVATFLCRQASVHGENLVSAKSNVKEPGSLGSSLRLTR